MNYTADIPVPLSLEGFIHCTAGQNRYLVLDCYQGNEFEDALKHFGVKESALFRMPVHTDIGGKQDPLLVHLDNEHAEALMQLAVQEAVETSTDEILGMRNISALVSSGSKPDFVARHIARAAHTHLQNTPGSKSVPFRFFDPRVMHTVQRIFMPIQKAILLGPIMFWGYVDFRGQLRFVKNGSPRGSSMTEIDSDQIPVLHRNILVQQTLHYLQKYRADWPEDLDAELDGIIAHAPDEFWEAEEDLIGYAALCWLNSTGRTDARFIEQAQELRRSTSALLTDVVETLSPELFYS